VSLSWPRRTPRSELPGSGISAIPLTWFANRISADRRVMGAARSGWLSRVSLIITFIGMAGPVVAHGHLLLQRLSTMRMTRCERCQTRPSCDGLRDDLDMTPDPGIARQRALNVGAVLALLGLPGRLMAACGTARIHPVRMPLTATVEDVWAYGGWGQKRQVVRRFARQCPWSQIACRRGLAFCARFSSVKRQSAHGWVSGLSSLKAWVVWARV
jgi:hypothetical protein